MWPQPDACSGAVPAEASAQQLCALACGMRTVSQPGGQAEARQKEGGSATAGACMRRACSWCSL